MSLTHCINKRFDKKFKAEWVPKDWRSLPYVMHDLFFNYGEGMYVSILQSTNNDFVAKMIAFFTGKFSHCFHIYYSENLRSEILDEEYGRIIDNWKVYYNFTQAEAEAKFAETNLLILASADKTGMNYPDFGVYAARQQSIRKLYTNNAQNTTMLRWYLSANVMNSIYDYCGLALWGLKIFDDPEAFYCSEIVYDAAHEVGYEMATHKDPSPTGIYTYHDNGETIFENL